MAPTTDVRANGSDDIFAETAFTAAGAEVKRVDDMETPTTPDRGQSPVHQPVASPEIIAMVQQAVREQVREQVQEQVQEHVAAIKKEIQAATPIRMEKKHRDKSNKDPKKRTKRTNKHAYSPRQAHLAAEEERSASALSADVAGTDEDTAGDFDSAVKALTGDFDAVQSKEPEEQPGYFSAAYEVEIERNDIGGGTFGISLDGGIETNEFPTVAADPLTVVEKEGHIEPNNLLLKIGNSIVAGLTHAAIVEIIRTADKTMKLTLVPLAADDTAPSIRDVLRDAIDEEPLTIEILKSLRDQVFELTTPYTTRPKREGEVEGREYHFVSLEEFQKMIDDDSFFEYGISEANQQYYGTPLPKVEQIERKTHLKRNESLYKIKIQRANEATVQHVLHDVKNSASMLEKIRQYLQRDPERLAVSEFLTSVAPDDPNLHEVRAVVKAAYYNISVPYTTRPMREGEVPGREFNFVSVDEFKKLIEQDVLLEYGIHNNHLYGTPRLGKDQADPSNASRLNRSETLKAALQKRSADAKVSELLAQSDARGTAEYELAKDMTVSQFLHDISPEDPILSELRTKVKRWLYDCTVPYTTRPPRAGELSGRDFNFVSPEVFDQMVLNNDFIEYGAKNGFQYGTPRLSSANLAHMRATRNPSRSAHAMQRSGAVTVGDVLEAVGDLDTVVDGVTLQGKPVADCDVVQLYKSVSVAVAPEHDPADGNEAALVALKRAVQRHVHVINAPVTSRPMRQGEREGVHYTFVTKHEFYRLVANDELLEFGDHDGHYYGTPTPTRRDLVAYVRGTSSGQRSRGPSAAAVGADGDVEVTMGDIRPFLTQDASMVPDGMVLSEFFHRVPQGHATYGALRTDVLQYVYDHTVPYTTRAARTGERNGLDYHFVSEKDFHALVAQQFFFEYSKLHGVLYGTPRVSKREHFRDGDVAQPAYSRREHVTALLANDVGELTVGYFVDKHGMSTLEHDRDVPVSVYLANVNPDHPEYGETRKKVQQILYGLTLPVTTRPPRENEKDGREYRFVSSEEFDQLVESHALLEHGEHNGNRYGTLRLLARDLNASYARLRAIRDHTTALDGHATVNEVLQGAYKHTALDRVGTMSYSKFLKSTHPEDPELAQLRAHVKAAIYAAVVPVTTRPIRPSEVENREYVFVTKEVFMTLVDKDGFLEWGEVNSELYGTLNIPRSQVRDGGIKHLKTKGEAMVQAALGADSPTAILEDKLARSEHREIHASGQINDIEDILSTRNDDSADDANTLLDRIHEVTQRPLPPFTGAEESRAGPRVDISAPTKVHVSDSVHDELRQQVAAAREAQTRTEAERAALAEQVKTHEESIQHLNEQLRAATIALIVEKSLPGITPEQLAARLATPMAPPPAASAAPVMSTASAPPTAGTAAAPGADSVDPGPAHNNATLPSVMVATPRAWGPPNTKGMTPLKAKMAQRRWEREGGMAGYQDQPQAKLSPLKLKLEARRKARRAASATQSSNLSQTSSQPQSTDNGDEPTPESEADLESKSLPQRGAYGDS
eukprot:m.1579186 g.1579186  ORF g.1579186 m.1579186 type:complete len:1522 (+) comp25314_c0_seq17:169-4734(+)